MKNILFITTMYPDPLRPGTDVCHYFTREWVKMGYNVLVINYRSMFPSIYTTMARLFPKLALKYIGNHVEMDTNKNIIQHEVEGIPVYSIPIFKYVPHGKYPQNSISKQIKNIQDIIDERNFIPDAIIGHFYNPQMEIISKLKYIYTNAHTSVVLHEPNPNIIKKTYRYNYKELINSIDIIGYRSQTMQKLYEIYYGHINKSFICYSGTNPSYISTPVLSNKFSNGNLSKFLYVGQFTKNKCVKSNIEAINLVYSNEDDYNFTLVGEGPCIYEINKFIEDHDIKKHITFTGWLQREDIINYYDENECFIMISITEAFGLVYLEAMARGCIVIGTRGQGIDGVIKDGENGYLCKGGDSIELASIIKRINALSAEEKKKISDNARQAAEQFSDYNVAKMYIESVMNS